MSSQSKDPPKVAVLIPCFNEEHSVAKVVSDFRAEVPYAKIYVYDNSCTDETASVARAAGAIVKKEPLVGKGNVIRRMFADIEADIFVMVDGDDTYSAKKTASAIEDMQNQNLDMITGVRKSSVRDAYRPGHIFGNAFFTSLVALIFGARTRDMLSGYRVFSRRYVKSFPALSRGFEIETEITVHALELRMPIADIEINYKERPDGSVSKLRTIRDGWRIFKAITLLVKEERPMPFFSSISGVFLIAAVVLGVPVITEYIETGLVPRLPTALLSSALVIISFLMFLAGIIIDSLAVSRREAKRLSYLSFVAPGNVDSSTTDT